MTDFSMLNGKTISFIGGGNMAHAIIDGLLQAKNQHNLALTLCVSDSDDDKQAKFRDKGLIATNPDNAHQIIEGADVVVLAVKPQIMHQVAGSIAPYLQQQTVLSIAAGLSIQALSHMLGGYDKIVRCMPNLPASKGFGASGLYAFDVSDEVRLMTQNIMQASGKVSWVEDESLLHAVTAVAGSAPAYFFYVLENMIAKAVEMGLSPEDAHTLAVQSMRGAAALAEENNPAVLREQVTS